MADHGKIVLFDSLQRKKVSFAPLDQHVGLYVCGPTVYNVIHLGNARPLVVFDVVARHLRARGLQVTYVRNITDVDDKIIRRAAELGETPAALAERFTAQFHADVAALCCEPPTAEPRVTDNIAQIIALISRLVAKQAAYAVDGDVYFAVGEFAGYGELSHQPLQDLKSGARVEVDERKRAPLDFALWKAAKPGEPSWPSPWGPGRPGWHIECSAMAERHLGVSFDLHGGGVDLCFPHHENERAQSQAANGPDTFARYWLHNGFINFNGSKISKSDSSQAELFERAFRLGGLIERHGGETVRAFLLTTHYRNPVQFEVVEAGGQLSFPGLEEVERYLEYGYSALERLTSALAGRNDDLAGATSPEADNWLDQFCAALDDDFNTAEAIAHQTVAFTLVNRILDGKLSLPKDVKWRTLARLQTDLAVTVQSLGLFSQSPRTWLNDYRTRRCQTVGLDAAWVESVIAERNGARKQKDFARADDLRKQLEAAGVELMDSAVETSWRVANSKSA